MNVPTITPDPDFDKAARLVLDYLNANVPLALWSVTRVENGRQTFLYLDQDNGYAKPRGDSHPWQDSFCIHMAAGTGPNVATDAQAVPVYASAGVNDIAQIGAYGGAVINEPDGQLFGAICGIDPHSQLNDAELAGAAPLLRFMGQMLTLVLAGDRERNREASRLLEATLASETDALTGLHNRRAWDRVVAEEEARFQRFADPTVAVMMDLDHLKIVNDTKGHAAGDAYIQAAGAALRSAVRMSDFVARLGGDEFAVLMRQCTEENAAVVVAHIHDELDKAGVASSVGWAPITVLKGFPGAIADADAAMYAAKVARREARPT
jgi:diguanylate cyclase (GGDEF)-like protein